MDKQRETTSGHFFEDMKKTRAQFKLALRYCKDNIEVMKANFCGQRLLDTDPHKFQRNIHKISNSKVNTHVTSVAGVSGKHSVVHVEKLF